MSPCIMQTCWYLFSILPVLFFHILWLAGPSARTHCFLYWNLVGVVRERRSLQWQYQIIVNDEYRPSAWLLHVVFSSLYFGDTGRWSGLGFSDGCKNHAEQLAKASVPFLDGKDLVGAVLLLFYCTHWHFQTANIFSNKYELKRKKTDSLNSPLCHSVDPQASQCSSVSFYDWFIYNIWNT